MSRRAEPPLLTVQLLGERCLWSGARNVSAAIRYRKGWGLLGYLAMESGRRHSRTRLAQLFWPSLEAGSARTNLRQVLSDLNQALDSHGGTGLLEVDRESVGLFPAPGTTIDLLVLGAAENAVAESVGMDIEAVERDAERFGGEFLHGLALPDCEDFADWLQLARNAIGKRTEAVLTRLCGLQRAANRLPQAIASARRLVSTDGWNEHHRRLLMGLLAAAGMHAQALEEYESLHGSLAAELGSEPEARTQALRARIEADRRRGLASRDAATPAAAGGMRRWFNDLLGAREGGGTNDGDEEFDTGPMTQRTLQVSDQLRTPGTGWIEVVDGPGQGTRLVIGVTPLVIGRSRDNDLCIAHETVSRHHCAIWREGPVFHIRDLGSTNRTRVNEAMVEEAELGNDDLVMLGETVLRFTCD
ncbi:MAG: FHA domain-containing protein [Lysobacter sp.]